jgi:hypothetical protein
MHAMWRLRFLVVSCALAAAACAESPVSGRPTTDNAVALSKDEPLSPEAPDPPGEAPAPRIHIASASFGASCNQPEDNDTLYMRRRCDGRRRCERRIVARPITRNLGNGRNVPCLPEYKVQWTCDGDPHPRVLRSIPSEQDTLRLRLGCGLEDPTRLHTVKTPEAGVPPTGDDEDTVRGRVVTSDGMGWNRATITVGESSVLTDGHGEFVVHGVPKRYDVRIGWTMYLGLTRRDPVLVVGGNYYPQGMRYHAAVTDAVSTQIVSNQGRWARRVVQFLAPGVAVAAREGHAHEREREREIGWRGDTALSGLFVSLMNDGPENDPWASAFLATETLSLTDGDAVAAAPRLRKIGSGRIAGAASLRGPAWPSQTPETLRFSYVVPGLTGSIDLGPCRTDGKFDCRLPDLSELGGEYCMVIGVGNELSNPRISRCGGQLGMRDFSEPPAPTAPVMRHGSEVDQDTMIAWTGEGHVFEVSIGPGWNTEAPIRIFTAQRSLSWSDFLALGMTWDEFVRQSEGYGQARYSAPTIDVNSVASLSPYQSMDDLVSGRNLMVKGASWQKVPSPRGEDLSEKGFVSLPKSVASRLQAVKAPDAKPLDLFHLPTCASTDGATAIADIRPTMIEAPVSVRGTLTWTGDWACTLMGCEGGCCNHCSTTWIVTDPRMPGNGMLLHPKGHRGNLGMGANECEIPKAPSIDVIATGVLLPRPRQPGEIPNHRYVLDEASLCAVGSEAGHP